MEGQLRLFNKADYKAWPGVVRDEDGFGPLIFEDMFVNGWPSEDGRKCPYITMVVDADGLELISSTHHTMFYWDLMTVVSYSWMARELVTMGENYALSVEFLEHLGFEKLHEVD